MNTLDKDFISLFTFDSSGNTNSLLSLILDNIPNPSYELSLSQINWINAFVKASPESFVTIKNDIKKITSDGQIDLYDIPLLIKLITDVYNSGAIQYGLSHPEYLIIFVRFTLDVILDSKFLILPDIEKIIIKKLVDVSLDLLSTNLPAIEQRTTTLCKTVFYCWK